MTRIIVGGDVCPMGGVEQLFTKGDAPAIFHDLLPEIQGADLSIVNLECPLVSRSTPTPKNGSILTAPVEAVRGISAAGWKLGNLANNHSFDHGAAGLHETIRAAREAGMGVVGAGSNLREASEPFVSHFNGQRIVVYSMAEREYSIADRTAPGANPLDLIRCVQAMREHKQGGMFLVLIHGGLELFPYPTPEMVRQCRFLVEMGADAVICCHSHCPLPWEVYANRPIVYGLGNLVFEPMKGLPDSWHEGYLADLTIQDGGVKLKVIPYIQSKGHSGAKTMTSPERERFMNDMATKTAQLQDEAFLENRWQEACRQRKDDYLCDLLGYNRYMRKLRRPLFSTIHTKRAVLGALHLTQCETHREVLNTLFRDERLGQ